MGTEGPLSTVGVAALSDDDGRAGAVFAETNSPHRQPGPRLPPQQRRSAHPHRCVRYGRTRKRGFEQVAKSLILGSSRRSSPADLGGSPKLLFVTNTASNVTRCSGCSTCSTAAAPAVTGGQPNITGSRVCRDGRSRRSPDSTRPVGGGAISGCPHVLFDRTGTILSGPGARRPACPPRAGGRAAARPRRARRVSRWRCR